jgi:hypothetical protein
MARMMGLNFKIVYKKGKENLVADALSRVGHMMAIQAVSAVQLAWVQVFNSYTTNPTAQQLLKQLAISSPDTNGYSLDKGVIWHKGKVWIGQNSALQTKLISVCHSSVIGGHSGIAATYHRLKRHFFWKGMKIDVESFVKQCTICQQAKHSLQHPMGLLQPLPIPQGMWKDLTMDFIEGLPKSEGFSVILVVVDRLTKYSHFILVKRPYTASTIAKLFMENIVKLHGIPTSIVTDIDAIFVSNFWKEFFTSYKIDLKYTAAYYPQTDGQSERVNQCLEMYLRCVVHASPKEWKSWLWLAELWYNTSLHASLGSTPFKALYGYDTNLGLLPTIAPNSTSTATDQVQQHEQQLEVLKQDLTRAQNKYKQAADKNIKGFEFSVGDQVLLKLQPYTQSSVANKTFPKLAFKYYGPFSVLQRIGKVAYKLDIASDSLIHPVFHISQLKPYTPNYTSVFDVLPKLTDLEAANTVPEQILEHRMVKRGNIAIP